MVEGTACSRAAAWAEFAAAMATSEVQASVLAVSETFGMRSLPSGNFLASGSNSRIAGRVKK